MTEVGRALARYACNATFEDLPEDVRREGVRAFVNWIGCAAGGCREETVEILLRTGLEFSSGSDAILVGRSECLDILNAAFVNATSSSVHSFNDTHFETVAHPTSPVAASLLALAGKRRIPGRDLVHALILGIELQCRVGRILTASPAECHIGLSMAGLVGGIGAATAVAKILGLDEDRMLTAIGIAANQAAGLREAHATMSSHFTPGHAARGGVYAALLAAQGFTCSPTMLEGKKGFGVSFSRNPNFAAAVEELGQSFEMRKLAYKPYPCGFVIHPVIDACLEVARNHDVAPDGIAAIELRISPVAAALTDRPNPADRRQALVSYQHWAAASLARKSAGLSEGDEDAVHDPTIASLRSKVAAQVDDALGREAAHATVRMRNGNVFHARIADCLGSARRPMSDAELVDKFAGQACLAWPKERAEEAAAWSWRILDHEDVGAEARLLRA